MVTSLLAGGGVSLGAESTAQTDGGECQTAEQAAATFFAGIVRRDGSLLKQCLRAGVPVPKFLPVEVTGYALMVRRPVPLLGAYFGSPRLEPPYRTEPGDLQIGVEFHGPWDQDKDVRVGEGWAILRPEGPDRWVILGVETSADVTRQRGGPLRPSPASECKTSAEAVRTFLRGTMTQNRRAALQCSYFWKWGTDHPQYVGSYKLLKTRPMPPECVGQDMGGFTYEPTDRQVIVRYQLAHQYRGLLHGRRPPVGEFTFSLRRNAEGEWKILSVTRDHDD